MLPGYKYLLTYRYSEIIHDLTDEFLKKFLFGKEHQRTRDQMFQAARSGKQNIVEGISAGKTSKKTEIKLLNVASASLDELLTDYEDYLRQRKLPIWPKNDDKVKRMQHYGYRISDLSNLSDLGSLKEKPILPPKPVVAANLLLTLCHLATYLLSNQIQKAEKDFLEKGGFTENLFKRRIQSRMKV